MAATTTPAPMTASARKSVHRAHERQRGRGAGPRRPDPRAPPRADSFRRARGALRGWTRPEVRDPLRASGAAGGGAREAAGERHAAVNGVRHNLTKSQRAMAIAKLF